MVEGVSKGAATMPAAVVKAGRKERIPGPKAFIYGRMFNNPDVAKLTYAERWLWLSLITHADHDGRGRAEPEFLKAEAFGFDSRIGIKKIGGFLDHLTNAVGLLIYDDSGAVRASSVQHTHYQITTWRKFQVIDRAYYRPSEYPAPPAELYCDPWYPSDLSPSLLRLSSVLDKSHPLVTIRSDPSREKRDPSSESSSGTTDLPPSVFVQDPQAKEVQKPLDEPLPEPLPERNAKPVSTQDSILDSPQDSIESPDVGSCPLKDGTAPLLSGWCRQLGMETPGTEAQTLLAAGLADFCRTLQGCDLCRRGDVGCGCRRFLATEVARIGACENLTFVDKVELLGHSLPMLAKNPGRLTLLGNP